MVNEVNLMNMMYAANGKKVKSDFTSKDDGLLTGS